MGTANRVPHFSSQLRDQTMRKLMCFFAYEINSDNFYKWQNKLFLTLQCPFLRFSPRFGNLLSGSPASTSLWVTIISTIIPSTISCAFDS